MNEPLAEIEDFQLDQLLSLLANGAAPTENRRRAYALIRERHDDHPRVAWHLRRLESDLFRLGCIKSAAELDRLPAQPPTIFNN